MKQIVFILMWLGLAYLGAVQLIRFLYRHYQRLVMLYRDWRLFLRSRKEDKPIIEARTEKTEAYEENVLLAEVPAQFEIEKDLDTQSLLQKELPEEERYLSVETGGESHCLSETITPDELKHMGKILSCESAPIEEEARVAATIYKLKDTPMLQEIEHFAGKRVRELMRNVGENAPKVVKEGDFDYSRFIHT